MEIRKAGWESRILDLAYRGMKSPPHEYDVKISDGNRAKAYELCSTITYNHSRTFFMASSLLPPAKRQAMRALYAFCRTSDDIVDQARTTVSTSPREKLENWRLRAAGSDSNLDDDLVLAWSDTQVTYGIPRLFVEQLLDGVARDLVQTRYETFEDLTTYCYSVASTVGLMAMHIVGFSGAEAIPYAVKLGIALQMTNILRDISEDWATGRLYLPLEELAAFGLTPDDIDAHVVTDGWRRFMQFQIARVRKLYAEALPGVQMLQRDGRFAVGAAAELYAAILNDIEAHDMDVFSRRAFVPKLGKLRRLPRIWWRANVTGYPRLEHNRLTGDKPNGANRSDVSHPMSRSDR